MTTPVCLVDTERCDWLAEPRRGRGLAQLRLSRLATTSWRCCCAQVNGEQEARQITNNHKTTTFVPGPVNGQLVPVSRAAVVVWGAYFMVSV